MVGSAHTAFYVILSDRGLWKYLQYIHTVFGYALSIFGVRIDYDRIEIENIFNKCVNCKMFNPCLTMIEEQWATVRISLYWFCVC